MVQCANLNFNARFQSHHKKNIKEKLKLSQIVLIDEQSNESQESKSQQSQLYRTLLSSLSFNPRDFSEKDLKFDQNTVRQSIVDTERPTVNVIVAGVKLISENFMNEHFKVMKTKNTCSFFRDATETFNQARDSIIKQVVQAQDGAVSKLQPVQLMILEANLGEHTAIEII
jgi:hypothetical protein